MIIWINENESIPYPPLISLKEILVKLDMDVDELKLDEGLLECRFTDCYTKKEIDDYKLKIYGSYWDYREYETIIRLTEGDLVEIIKYKDNNHKVYVYYDCYGFPLGLLSKKLAKERLNNFLKDLSIDTTNSTGR